MSPHPNTTTHSLLLGLLALALILGACSQESEAGEEASESTAQEEASSPDEEQPTAAEPNALQDACAPRQNLLRHPASGSEDAQPWLAQLPSPESPLLPPRDVAILATSLRGQAGSEPTTGLLRSDVLSAAFERHAATCEPGACAAFVPELLTELGVPLPESPAFEGEVAGTYDVDLRELEKPRRALSILDAAHSDGVVLLHLEHEDALVWALYLGRDATNRPRVMHALPQLRVPCPSDPEKPVTLDVAGLSISDLELAQDGEGALLLHRLKGFTVIGGAPGLSLLGILRLREPQPVQAPPEASCQNRPESSIFVSPSVPNIYEPMRVIAALSYHPGPAELVLIDPRGNRHTLEVRELGGPPFGYVMTQPKPRISGTWTAVLGDGTRVEACHRFEVHRYTAKPEERSYGPVWEVTEAWDEAYENLYALFVESLFDYPLEQEDELWYALHPILRDEKRNLLYGHRHGDEEKELRLYPDCADLSPYLRALFAWKLGLPFSYHYCTRGTPTRPATCGRHMCNNRPRKAKHATEAFYIFLRKAKRAVHSASGLTDPRDPVSDFYPVELSREAIAPGTIFSDPYDHVIMVVRWIPQSLNGPGILMAADAQSSAQIGFRRFWRGNFIFDPKVGGGFQRHRPVRYQGPYERYHSPTNAELEQMGYTRIGYEQYEGTDDAFHARMEELISPRPLDPFSEQENYVKALHEQVLRRVTTVDKTEAFMKTFKRSHISMPRGVGIFSTVNEWEAHSTPSRDLRLLIAIDQVLEFPDAVARHPERYSFEEGADVETLRKHQRKLLEQYTFDYTRSDGSTWTLTMAELLDRRAGLEVAYNPNDCIEVRWGAPEGSEERKPCRRRALQRQRRQMEKYRHWFSTRQRPRVTH